LRAHGAIAAKRTPGKFIEEWGGIHFNQK